MLKKLYQVLIMSGLTTIGVGVFVLSLWCLMEFTKFIQENLGEFFAIPLFFFLLLTGFLSTVIVLKEILFTERVNKFMNDLFN